MSALTHSFFATKRVDVGTASEEIPLPNYKMSALDNPPSPPTADVFYGQPLCYSKFLFVFVQLGGAGPQLYVNEHESKHRHRRRVGQLSPPPA